MRGQLSQILQTRWRRLSACYEPKLVIDLNDVLAIANQLLGQVHIVPT